MSLPIPLHRTLRRLRPDAPAVGDDDLLRRFADHRDEASFELLVYRHGPMVWATCRRILGYHSAEDAFQATFLALARKAATIRKQPSVAAWLHRVAVRAAIDARRTASRSAALPIEIPVTSPDAVEAGEIRAQIDRAIERLPKKLRQAFILCELEGHTASSAARAAGCPAGTMESRLGRARRRLRDALGRRGLVPTLLGPLSVPVVVRAAAVRAAVHPAAASAVVERLAVRAVASTMPRVAVGLTGVIVSVVTLAAAAGPMKEAGSKSPPPTTPAKVAVASDAEPLPEGAVARLGSPRFRMRWPFENGLAFSPDGTLLAAMVSNELVVWEAETGRAVRRIQEKNATFLPGSIHFDEAGKQLVVPVSVTNGAAPPRMRVRVYDLNPSGKSFDIGGESADVELLGLGTGRTVVAQVRNGPKVARVEYRLADGQEASKLELAPGEVPVHWTNSVERLLVRVQDRLEVRDRSGKVLWRRDLAPDRPAPSAMLCGRDQVLLLEGRRATVHDLGDGGKARTFTIDDLDENDSPTRIATSDGRYATLHAHHATTGPDFVMLDVRKAAVALVLPNHFGSTSAFSHDSRWMATCFQGDDSTTVWDLGQTPPKAVAQLPVAGGLKFSPDGRRLAVLCRGSVSLFETKTWTALPQSASPSSAVDQLKVSPDGQSIFAAAAEGWRVWKLADPGESRIHFGRADGHRSQFTSISNDGHVIVEAVHANRETPRTPRRWEIRVFDRRDSKNGPTRTLNPESSIRREAILSGDGRRVWAHLVDKNAVRGWDTATGRELLTIPLPGKDWDDWSIAASNDGRYVAVQPHFRSDTPEHDRNMQVWDVDAAKLAARIPNGLGTGQTWNTIQFSHDGRRLAAVVTGPIQSPAYRAYEGGVTVWDWQSKRTLCHIPRIGLASISLSPDGRTLAIGEFFGPFRTFEVATGLERGAFRHEGSVFASAFHADGTRLIAASAEAPILVWDLLGKPGPWESAKAEAVWADLGSLDAKVAFSAMRKIRAHPKEGIEFLRGRMPAVTAPAREKIADWIAQLDSDRFATRERAERALLEVADCIEPQLTAARKTASPEAAARLDRIMASLENNAPTPARLRQVRVCEVLEAVANREAMSLLKSGAAGASGACLTREAVESLQRRRNSVSSDGW